MTPFTAVVNIDPNTEFSEPIIETYCSILFEKLKSRKCILCEGGPYHLFKTNHYWSEKENRIFLLAPDVEKAKESIIQIVKIKRSLARRLIKYKQRLIKEQINFKKFEEGLHLIRQMKWIVQYDCHSLESGWKHLRLKSFDGFEGDSKLSKELNSHFNTVPSTYNRSGFTDSFIAVIVGENPRDNQYDSPGVEYEFDYSISMAAKGATIQAWSYGGNQEENLSRLYSLIKKYNLDVDYSAPIKYYEQQFEEIKKVINFVKNGK